MAIYYNMCIDCGQDRPLAERLFEHFAAFTIEIPKHAPVQCTSYSKIERNISFVGVFPRGMGIGTLPASEHRPELIDDDLTMIIRQSLYNELRGHLGFQRAVFGSECWDWLVMSEDARDDVSIDHKLMIFSTAANYTIPPECIVEPWIDGYQIVTASRYGL